MSRNRCFSLLTVAALSSAIAAPAIAQTVARKTVKRDVTLELACGAQAALEAPKVSTRIVGGQEAAKTLFGTGEALILSGGTDQGLKIGQEFFVRRVVPDRFTTPISDGVQPISVHTAGWLRIVDVQPTSALATVVHACDGIEPGDYIEPFVMPVMPASVPSIGEPDYANAGHLILGDEHRQMGAIGTMMVIDRGSDHGLRAGQWLTIFRDTQGRGSAVFRVGLAQVITVNSETSLVRIQSTRDAVYVGDRVAIHR